MLENNYFCDVCFVWELKEHKTILKNSLENSVLERIKGKRTVVSFGLLHGPVVQPWPHPCRGLNSSRIMFSTGQIAEPEYSVNTACKLYLDPI
jgi:hypothetical protein